MRDHQCEDGDQIRVSVNGGVVFSGELFNAADCRIVPVREGTNSVELFAINGTGFKGACSYADANTGEITIRGSTASVETQNWRHTGGTGSRANLNVTVTPTGAGCIPGSQPANRAPERLGDIPAQMRTVGASETVDVSAFFEDPDGDSLGYSVQVSDPAIVVATVSGERVTFRAVAAGTVTITVTATDAGGLSATQTFTVEVSEGETDQIDDFNVGIPSSCPRGWRFACGTKCEDGDQIRVSVNGGVLFSGELFNAADCRIVPVRKGRIASSCSLSGTGFKGACSYARKHRGDHHSGKYGLGGNP